MTVNTLKFPSPTSFHILAVSLIKVMYIRKIPVSGVKWGSGPPHSLI